jgi:hypothetical protein
MMERDRNPQQPADSVAEFWSAASGMAVFAETAQMYTKLVTDWQRQTLEFYAKQFAHVQGADKVFGMWLGLLDNTTQMSQVFAPSGQKAFGIAKKPGRPEAAE